MELNPIFIQNDESEHDEYWMCSLPTQNKETKSCLIYFIPGNPGAVRSYKLLIQKLYQRTNFDICVCGHRGHSAKSKNIYSLEEQTKHHVTKIKQYCQGYNNFGIIAHSLGGYISYKLSEELKTIDRNFKGFLFISPVLSRFPATLTNFFWYFYSKPVRIFCLYFLRHVSCLRYFFPEPQEVFYDITKGCFVENVFHTLDETINNLDSLPYKFLKENQICVVYASPDKFISDAIQKEVNNCLNDKHLKIGALVAKSLTELDHGFYPSEYQNILLVELISYWLENGLLDII